MKVFLATSFSGKLDAITGEMVPEYREFIEQLLAGLRKVPGCEVFCASEDEGWRISEALPEIGVKGDLDELEQTDVLFALMHDKPSAGVQFELGYAVAKGKRVIVALAADEPLAYYNQGIVSMGLMTEITYDSIDSLIQNATVALSAPADEVLQ